MRNSILLGFCLLLYVPVVASAQPVFRLVNLDVQWPTVSLHLDATCDRTSIDSTAFASLELTEQGRPIDIQRVFVPSNTPVRVPCSVGFTLDATDALTIAEAAAMKAAVHHLIGRMDGVADTASVRALHSAGPGYVQARTNDTVLLHSAVSGLGRSSGGKKVWDVLYEEIQYLIANGAGQIPAIVLSTDGWDSGSMRSSTECIALATANRIRVYVLGFAASINSVELGNVAMQTGGRFHANPSTTELNAVFSDVTTMVLPAGIGFIVQYTSPCADGSRKSVQVRLPNLCGVPMTVSTSYIAPLDSTTFSNLQMELGDGEGKGDTDITVPLHLLTPINNDLFYPFSFTLAYDTQCLQFQRATAAPGSLIAGLSIETVPVANGVRVSVKDKRLVSGNGLVLELTFKAKNAADTTVCPLRMEDAGFEQGCFIPLVDSSRIRIIPRAPKLHCDMTAPPALSWQRQSRDYTPNPFPVTARFFNVGDTEARNARYKISFDTSDVRLVAPLTDEQMGSPKDIVSGGVGEVSWQIAAKKRSRGDTVMVCITASFDNHVDEVCCARFWIPPAEPILDCTLDAPPIIADNVNLRYNPMPFPVTVTVTNTGGMRTDSVWATITLPKDLELAAPDIPDRHTKRVMPSLLFPNQSGSVMWMVRHPNIDVEKSYVVTVWVKTSNADSSKCEVTVVIPPLDSPILQPRCYVPTSLVFDENADSYVPNPFTVRLTTVNMGNTEVRNVTGTIILPPDMEFDPPGQPVTKTFTPSTMGKYVPPAPAPELTWTVRFNQRYHRDSTLQFRFTVTGKKFTDIQLDSVEVRCQLQVPGLQATYTCRHEMPDSLGVNAAGTDVEPNPFTIRYTITNNSHQVGKITRVRLGFPPDGISLHPTSPNPMDQTMDLVLGKGESRTFEWIIGVQNRITRRDVRISVTALDDEGTPIECTDNLPIANLRISLLCEATAQPPGLFYDAALREYNPSTFIVSARLRNAGGMTLHDVAAELTWSDTSGLDLLEFDSGVPGQANPVTWAVLLPDSSVEAHWAMRLKNPNISGRPWYPNFLVRYVSRETAQIRNGCEVPVIVGPTDSPVLQCTLNAPDSVRFIDDRYQPGSFDVGFELRNIGKAEARNVKAYLLQGKGFMIESPSLINLPPLPVGWSIDRPDAFRVRVLFRETEGYDTIRIAVVADGISTQCEIPVFVERELRPRFELSCIADAALHFDELSNDYVPNPLPLRTLVRNVGGARARQVAVTFTGPPSFTPFNQIMTQTLGDIEAGEERTLDWMLVPMRRDNAGVEDVRFELQARSGIDDHVITEECGVDVYVPAARRLDYHCSLTAPRIRVDSTRGGYQPDPFVIRARVTNIGQALGRGLVGHAILPGGLTAISPLDVSMRDSLVPGAQSEDAVWRVRPLARSVGDTVVFRVLFTDAFGNSTECHLPLWIPGIPDAGVMLSCDAEVDSLLMYPGDTGYRNADFRVRAWIGNTGAAALYDVDAAVLTSDTALSVISANPVRIASRLDPGSASIPVEWTVHATPRDVAGWVRVQCIVSAIDAAGNPLPTRECVMWIYMQERRTPRLQCRVWTSATTADGQDTIIAYDPSTGYYEGVPSGNGAYPVLRVFLEVRNVGIVSASDLAGTLLLPAIMSMDQGQTSVKRFEPSTMLPGAVDTLTWDVRPMAVEEDSVVRFTALVNSREGETLQCEHVAVLQRVPAPVWLTIPSNLVGMRGQVIDVPVEIGRTDGRDVFSYYLGIRFNPSYLRFVDARNAGTVTASGWDGVKATVVREQGRGASGLLRLHDRTTTSPLSSTKEGVLLRLRFEVLYTPKRFDMIDRSPLEFVLHAVDSLGRELRSTMNAVREEDAGEIGLVVSDGLVTLAGDCIWPLVANTELGQNHPNPFNPVTIIPFTLGEETNYSLTLHDAFGRLVRVLERGLSAPGAYTYRLDASGLASGVYFYRLVTPWSSQTKRLLLAR